MVVEHLHEEVVEGVLAGVDQSWGEGLNYHHYVVLQGSVKHPFVHEKSCRCLEVSLPGLRSLSTLAHENRKVVQDEEDEELEP